MNRGPLIFLGIFFALAFSWTGIVLTNQIQYGSLTPFYDQAEGRPSRNNDPAWPNAAGWFTRTSAACIAIPSRCAGRVSGRTPSAVGVTARAWRETTLMTNGSILERCAPVPTSATSAPASPRRTGITFICSIRG